MLYVGLSVLHVLMHLLCTRTLRLWSYIALILCMIEVHQGKDVLNVSYI
jgi:hypothetical protein